ncbi:type II toxin-antitoxin system PemK/MazF family toxin [Gemella haemolysans]|uniref:type II toxin-antitoxin system PemK/MazF family toxin n=1 Tax=Gemella haemolysans TaxID=1379 RepID=UPI002379B856|nr:type II toxin-antitoxin system PemK/MazF family toxin [Gemella haemolysans]
MGKYKKYSRGTILLVDFGENVGFEFNGKHFAIVLNKNDSEKSGKLMVIPLTSKDKRNRHVKLDKSIIEELIKGSVSLALNKIYIYKKWLFLKNYSYNRIITDKIFLNYLAKRNAVLIKINEKQLLEYFKEDTNKLKEVSEYYSNYNKFSYARVDSIRDIDKSRILPKFNHLDPIGDIKLPELYLNKISKAIIKYCT